MKRICCVFFLAISIGVFADDGVFYANGSTLLPLKETSIRMKKEILNLTRSSNLMQVDIYFEFFNPGALKELTVGFVTPPADADLDEKEASHPHIYDFMVMVNDSLLPFKIIRMEKSGFKLNDSIASGNDFVYYFKVVFKPGLTVIRHSYNYDGGGSVETMHDYFYRLTTGTGWAGGMIEDFELNINMGNDCCFSVPVTFNDKSTPWLITGIGRLGNSLAASNVLNYGEGGIQMVYIKQGYLQARIKNFKPKTDLSITQYLPWIETRYWTSKTSDNDFIGLNEIFYDRDSTAGMIGRLSDAQLRLYKNLNYARCGYVFKDTWLKQQFSKYFWYIPDPAFKPENIVDRFFGQEFLQLLSDEENKRKKTENK
jgi:hypothetical protein